MIEMSFGRWRKEAVALGATKHFQLRGSNVCKVGADVYDYQPSPPSEVIASLSVAI